MPEAVILVGGGGFAVEIATYLGDMPNPPRVKGILDVNPPRGDFPGDLAWLGPEADYAPQDGDRFIIALGDSALRRRVAHALSAAGGCFFTLIHPSAYVASTAIIEEGAIICPFAFVGPRAKVGAHAVLNVRATIGHHAAVGDYAVLSPHVNLNGGAVAETGCFLGTGAVIAPKVSLGAHSKLAAGSVLSGDAPAGSLIVGNPGRGRVMFKPPAGI